MYARTICQKAQGDDIEQRDCADKGEFKDTRDLHCVC